MTGNKLKITPPPKLESKNLTLDKLQTWYSGMKNCFKHDPDHKQFLKGGAYETWTALKSDTTRGINIEPVYEATDDPNARALKLENAQKDSAKIREGLDDFLHLLGSKAPDGMYNTIVRQASSMEWVLARIKTAFRIQTKGIDLYDATEAGYDEEKDDSYDIAYMKMKDQFEDLLSDKGSKYHGEVLATAEAMTPLAESMITIQWLKSIHPGLPKHIKERHSHLFSDEKPNWADLQPDFVKMIDTLLTEVENRDSEEGDVRVGRLGSSFRGRGGQFRNTRGRNAYRGSGRGRSTVAGQNKFCDICHAAGKPTSVVNSHNMPWCGSLSTHGKSAIASSMRMAFVEEATNEENFSENYEEETEEPFQDI